MKSQPLVVPVLSPQEWLERYRARLMAVAGVTQALAESIGDTETYEMNQEFFDDDPEGAADEEMSYWDE